MTSANVDSIASDVMSAATKKAACFARNMSATRDVGMALAFCELVANGKVTRLKEACGNYVSCCEQTRS